MLFALQPQKIVPSMFATVRNLNPIFCVRWYVVGWPACVVGCRMAGAMSRQEIHLTLVHKTWPRISRVSYPLLVNSMSKTVELDFLHVTDLPIIN
jgi:hypothetical protein